ncbi:NHL repeat-containing protein [Rhodococcus xishaensis]|uniref:NHL repeat-containing protein n=1 Tax=Rhodococcus xishaensis TaxID=2487364 RepID=A0A3S3A1Y6_9NOCA|nr:NHL repeat-containing protein [Rhodococcus xishaensis]RVW00235.1 hypothetical protein EGT50_16600 [Rhodococcus xishaensis]
MFRRILLSSAVGLLVAGSVAGTPPAAPARSDMLSGSVRGADGPLAGYDVTAWAAGDGSTGPRRLGDSSTDEQGYFSIVLSEASADDVVYLEARDRSRVDMVLASVLGADPRPTEVVVNEQTTVASAFSMAQFATDAGLSGSAPGIGNAAEMVRNFVDVEKGSLSQVLTSSPNGSETSTVATFNSLSNMVAACVARAADCTRLLDGATNRGEPRPGDTFEAMSAIARTPSLHVVDLFAVAASAPHPYTPARNLPPAAWTLALRFDGDGRSLSGPGNFAIDSDGNIWVNSNYEYNADPNVPVCGSDMLFKFLPSGQSAPGSPFRGGGLSGAGFGIALDPQGDVWVGNFGFAAQPPGCPEDLQPPHNSVSKFTPDGVPLSPETGFTEGEIDWPQGTIADRDGNIWLANCGSNTLTRYPAGDPSSAQTLRDTGLDRPFALVDNGRHVFATGTGNNQVAVLGRDGTVRPNSPIGGFDNPMGVAADADGNVWVANSGIVQLPCPDLPPLSVGSGSVTLLDPDGTPAGPAFRGGGVTIPWGIAVDGDGNVWVANFGGKRLSHFCGTDPTTCPPGKSTGDAISPDGTGYAFDGLERNTGVAVDPSGNVWLANNWLEVPVQTNPGGHEIVAYVGIAPPVVPDAPIR